jgi:FixJ family two-component response regulator
MYLQKTTIAVIDDDSAIRQSMERMLSIAGFRVLAFSSGEEFLACVATLDAGCAVVDIDLGSMSGLDLARHPAVTAAKIPLIFISGTANESIRSCAIALGCIQFLRKPFLPVELLDAIFRATQEPPIP